MNETLKEFSEEDLYSRLGGSELGELSDQGSEYRFAGLIPVSRRFCSGSQRLSSQTSTNSHV